MSTAKTTASRPILNDIADIMRMIEDFGALLARETAALKKSDFTAVDTLQPAKRQMAMEYQNMVTALSHRRAEMATLDVTARENFVKARTHFTFVLSENLRALDAAKRSAKRLMGKILDVARKSVVDERQTNYSATGQAQAYKTSTLSLSVDHKL